jgi:post-segregation antitoxin (ccd killing protein)
MQKRSDISLLSPDELEREAKNKRFEDERRSAIESYNRFIAEFGLWGQEYRKW